MKPNLSLLRVIICALLTLAAGTLLALPEDRDQPIKIQSDRAERDHRSGVTIYSGDVQVDQGSLHISADKVVIEVEDDQVRNIVATGSPARMRQRPSLEDEMVHASGATIRYDVGNEVLTLLTNASITQEETFVSSERIDYFLRERRFQAQGSDSKAADRERVIMVFPPKQVEEQLNKADDEAPPAAAPSPDRNGSDGDTAGPQPGEEL